MAVLCLVGVSKGVADDVTIGFCQWSVGQADFDLVTLPSVTDVGMACLVDARLFGTELYSGSRFVRHFIE